MNKNIYTFNCTGGFDINSSLPTHKAWNGDVVAFNLPDGSTVDLFVGLRLTNLNCSSLSRLLIPVCNCLIFILVSIIRSP